MDGGGGGEITKIALDGAILLGKLSEGERERMTGTLVIILLYFLCIVV